MGQVCEIRQSRVGNFEELLDSKKAAPLLFIHPKTLQKMARKAEVPAHKIGRLWRFRASELDDWLVTRGKLKRPLVP
ncbi:MAG TPA: helix-turn-helix domain-containing protein [Bryobacteraceae bacterium]|jgi:excisionase family DNA binding protein|nr:helix-turn-helix domain-containing protein [Bryobacteraceae bacterium]